MCFIIQTHGNSGFLLSKEKATNLLKKHPEYNKILKPFLIGNELVGNIKSQARRFVIDFSSKNIYEAASYKKLYEIVEKEVLPAREERSKKQEKNNKIILLKNSKATVNKHHVNFYNHWWQLGYGRTKMFDEISKLSKYIVCSRVSKRQIFEFVCSNINPSDSLIVFAYNDDYSFGIIQAKTHWLWLLEKGGTMAGAPSYTSNSVWDTYPWPQKPTEKQIAKIAKASKALRDERNAVMEKNKSTLRDVYRILEKPGTNDLKDLHKNLDKAVIEAYGFDAKKDILEQLLELNEKVAQLESKEKEVQAPGLPNWITDKQKYISDDCVKFIG